MTPPRRAAASMPSSKPWPPCSPRARRRWLPPIVSRAGIFSRPGDNLIRVEKRLASAIPKTLAEPGGDTPMVRFTRVAPDCHAELIGKLESHNPAGSVKDRIGVSMVEAAEVAGEIEPGRTTVV